MPKLREEQMKESEKHQAQIDDECREMETASKSGLIRSAGRLLTLLGLKAQAEENERGGEAPRTRGRPRLKK